LWNAGTGTRYFVQMPQIWWETDIVSHIRIVWCLTVESDANCLTYKVAQIVQIVCHVTLQICQRVLETPASFPRVHFVVAFAWGRDTMKLYFEVWWRLGVPLAPWPRSTSLLFSTLGPVSTGMGDRSRVRVAFTRSPSWYLITAVTTEVNLAWPSLRNVAYVSWIFSWIALIYARLWLRRFCSFE